MSEPHTEQWAIVGGGMLGLTLAWRLARAGRRVTLFEGEDTTGGLAAGWQIGDLTWDKHYHVTLLSDSYLLGLLEELELKAQMQWQSTRTGVFADGVLHSVSNAWEFLRFPALGFVDKLRIARTIRLAARIEDWRLLENITAVDWLTHYSGDRATQRFWLPLLRSKLGDRANDISASFIWATMRRLYAARRAGLAREMFGYHPGGYARILSTFDHKLRELGVILHRGNPVRFVRPDGAGRIRVDAGTTELFDRVALTVPSGVVADICPDLTEAEKVAYRGVEYQGILCASLVLKRPLAGFYVTNLTDEGFPFTGIIEMTALVDPKQLGGWHLVYLPRYTQSTDIAWTWSESELQAHFLKGLRRVYPDLKDDQVLAFKVSRVRRGFALPTLGFSERLPSRQTSIPGLFVVNSAQIVNGTLNVNETVQLANAAAAGWIGKS
jgi:protoporphyrinogen oxidase